MSNVYYLSKSEVADTINNKMYSPSYPYTKFSYPANNAYEPIPEFYAPKTVPKAKLQVDTCIFLEITGNDNIEKAKEFTDVVAVGGRIMFGLACAATSQAELDIGYLNDLIGQIKQNQITSIRIFYGRILCGEPEVKGQDFEVNNNTLVDILDYIKSKGAIELPAFSDPDNNKIFKEIPDDAYFEHDHSSPYIEDAYTLYRRLGEHYKYNASPDNEIFGISPYYKNLKWSYKTPSRFKFTEDATKVIDGKEMLQIYVGDLKLTEEQCKTIWRASFYDYQEYLPKYCEPIFKTKPFKISIKKTENRFQLVERDDPNNIEKERHTRIEKVGSHVEYGEPEWVWDKKSIKSVNVTNSEFLDPNEGSKKIMEYIPAVDYTGPFTVTMGTSHWYGFNICEVDIGMDMNQVDTDFTGNPDTDYKYSTGWYYNPAYISRTDTINGYQYNIDANTPAGAISHIWGSQPPAFNEYAKHDDTPMSITLNNITFSKGKKYFIYTKECAGGGTDATKFVYNFYLSNDIEDEDEMDTNIPILYKRQQIPEKVVDDYAEVEYFEDKIKNPDFAKEYKMIPTDVYETKTIDIVEHMYLDRYDEEERQKMFQDIEDTFQDLRKYLESCAKSRQPNFYATPDAYSTGAFVGEQYKTPRRYNYEGLTQKEINYRRDILLKDIHDYLIKNNDYTDSEDPKAWSLYAGMSRKEEPANSCGYAMAYKHCCNRMGIITQVMTGIVFNDFRTQQEIKGGKFWHWNRVCNLDNFTEEYVKFRKNGINHIEEADCVRTLMNCINQYDPEHLNNYMVNGNLYYTQSVEPNYKKYVSFIDSHAQFYKYHWKETDLVYDTDYTQNGDPVPKSTFFGVRHDRLKQSDGGTRLLLKYAYTKTNQKYECYANFVGQDHHYDQYCSDVVNSKNRYFEDLYT